MALFLRLGESRIPELCKRAKISQAELGRKIGVSRQFIHLVVKRERDLSFEQAINVASILDCNVEYLHKIVQGIRTE